MGLFGAHVFHELPPVVLMAVTVSSLRLQSAIQQGAFSWFTTAFREDIRLCPAFSFAMARLLHMSTPTFTLRLRFPPSSLECFSALNQDFLKASARSTFLPLLHPPPKHFCAALCYPTAVFPWTSFTCITTKPTRGSHARISSIRSWAWKPAAVQA